MVVKSSEVSASHIYRYYKFILVPEIKQILMAFILVIKFFLAFTKSQDPKETFCE